MSNNQSSFREKLTIIIIDKLIIALIILFIGYFANTWLKNIDYKNQIYLKRFENELQLNRDSIANMWLKNVDHKNQIYLKRFENELQLNRDSIARFFLEKDREYKEYREELTKEKDYRFQEQMLALKMQYEVLVNTIESKNSIKQDWSKLSVEKIIKSWELINEANLSLEEFEKNVPIELNKIEISLSSLNKEYDEEIKRLCEKYNVKNYKELSSHLSKYNSEYPYYIDIDAVETFLANLNLEKENIQQILKDREDIKNLHLRVSSLTKKYLENKKDIENFYLTWLSTKVDELMKKLNNAKNFVNTNRHIIGEDDRINLITFIDKQILYINKLPKINSRKELEESIHEFNERKNDFHKMQEYYLMKFFRQ